MNLVVFNKAADIEKIALAAAAVLISANEKNGLRITPFVLIKSIQLFILKFNAC